MYAWYFARAWGLIYELSRGEDVLSLDMSHTYEVHTRGVCSSQTFKGKANVRIQGDALVVGVGELCRRSISKAGYCIEFFSIGVFSIALVLMHA
jgi:hypothetical protein